MSDWLPLSPRPEDYPAEQAVDGWFRCTAGEVLNGCRLVVGGRPHRFTEVEFYYAAQGHPDPFTHHDPVQLQWGRWYFHRSRGSYRSGSFKGLDLSFGDGTAFGGILIRGLERPDGTLIDGPSLLVDYLLAESNSPGVAALDKAIAGRPASDPGSPLFVQKADPADSRPLYRSARVGLSLKRAGSAAATRYIMCPYRFLTEPRRIAKGKLLLVLALRAGGTDPDAIHELTACPRQTIRRYVADFEAGRQLADFGPFLGIDLGPADLCRLYGVWSAQWGTGPAAGQGGGRRG